MKRLDTHTDSGFTDDRKPSGGLLVAAWWGHRAWLKGLVGIFAGQVLALHLLFGSVIATQMAAAATSAGLPVICYGSAPGSDGGQDSPAPGLRSHACIICAFATVAPLLPAECSIALVRDAALIKFTPFQLFEIQSRHRFEPRLPQGPPQQA